MKGGGAQASIEQTLDGLKVLDPTNDKKKMAKVRAQMIKASQAEREARKKNNEENAKL